MRVRAPPSALNKDMVSDNQKNYLAEYEKYKHIKIHKGQIYTHKQKSSVKYEIVSVDEEREKATLKNHKTGYTKEKTLHWCRKNLTP